MFKRLERMESTKLIKRQSKLNAYKAESKTENMRNET